METLKQLCIKSYEVKDDDGNCWKAVQGKVYTTSLPGHFLSIGPKCEPDEVVVFSNYWVPVPADHFVLAEVK